jgi:hypothetical protein
MFRVAAVGTLNATVTGPCQQVTVVGNTPTVSGFSNVFCCSATATQTNQAIFGTRLDVTGNNNNISVLGGYINALRSLVTPNTQTGTNFTLTLNNSYIRFTANSNVLTLPTLASIQALLPVGTGRTWFVSSTSLFASTNASSIVTTGGDVFNGITGLTSYFLEPNGTEVTLRSGSSGWLIQPFKQSALYSTGVANNIGVTPPLANASLLPTSTNQTTHEALGASSYCKMATRSANNTTLFGFGASNIGFTINSGGGYGDFEYTIVVVHTTAVAGTPYLLRFDVQDSVTGVTVPGSFSAFRGSNDISGSCTFNWRFTGYKTNLATYRLRISQSATFPITAAGSITFASIRAVQSF